MLLLSLFFHLLAQVTSLCDPNLLSTCDACCSMLFASEDCSEDIFRVKINGNGALGAIWDDAVTAVMVKPGCLLDMWDVRNQTGKHRAFGLDGKVFFNLEWYAFEKKASSLRCKCTTISPPTTTTEDPLTEYVEEGQEATEDMFIERAMKEDAAEVNITQNYEANSTGI